MPRWQTAEAVDWAEVRWVIVATVWLGGRSDQVGAVATTGPVHMWRFAVREGGEPADLNWVQLMPEYPRENWDMAHVTLLGALNFCACRNVELVEPLRPRAERRRIARTGVTVNVISVFPVGRATRGGGRSGAGVPLSSVRGHFAEYGVNGKGLLFGKLSGRFWIPQHARGSKELGESEHSYRLVG